ncbi:MAG: substrate-binding domain-containing protein [Candidatus Thiodiazotropha sp.]
MNTEFTDSGKLHAVAQKPAPAEPETRSRAFSGLLTLILLLILAVVPAITQAGEKRLAYLVSDQRIPFWEIMQRGVTERATQLGYQVTTYSADNSAKRELEHTARAIQQAVEGIILSPTNSSASVTILKLAASAGIPVVIADIGTEGGEYVSYIASDNRKGSYQIGRILVKALQARNWEQGSVGIIAIPQTRANGRARTAGFMQALDEAGIRGAGIHQQVNFSYRETYDFAHRLIQDNPDLRALWLQGSDRYQAALDAMTDSGRSNQVLLICFDAEPEFLELIPAGVLVGAAMQQPFLMGEAAVNALHVHLQGGTPQQQMLLPILAVSEENIEALKPQILRNVLGMAEQ